MERLPIEEFLRHAGLFGTVRTGEGDGVLPAAPFLPVVDVRSPCEYTQGHIPGAIGLPLFSDEERASVGTLYKREGSRAAVFAGLGYIGRRLEEFARQLEACAGSGGAVALYCSRGGMRSASVAWLCGTIDVKTVVLDGGYKAFRRHVLSFFERPFPLQVLGGRTGSGKTEVLRLMAERGAQVVDLEGLAQHRGSVFGALEGSPQPSCEYFENMLATALAQCSPERPIWVEDESENIGRVNIPRVWHQRLRTAPVTVISVPQEQRLARVLADYGDQPPERMGRSLDYIRKRLGGSAYKKAHACLADGDLPGLADVLFAYYDRAYDRQLHLHPPGQVVEVTSSAEAAERLAP